MSAHRSNSIRILLSVPIHKSFVLCTSFSMYNSKHRIHISMNEFRSIQGIFTETRTQTDKPKSWILSSKVQKY